MLHISKTVNSNNNLNSLDEDIDSLFIELPEFVEESISGGKAIAGVCHAGAVVTASVGFAI